MSNTIVSATTASDDSASGVAMYPRTATAQPQMGTGGASGRVTQLDIARVAGVHNTTVSLALRNSPSIPLATRLRIQAVAGELGYSPDPALLALASYRKALAIPHRLEPIAYVTNHPTQWGWRRNPAEEQMFLGAQRRATERGYQVEHFWLNELGMNPRRLSQVLFSRGITGVILAPHPSQNEELMEFEWERFCAIKIGATAGFPTLHSVACDWAGAANLALGKARSAGYRRPGLLFSSEVEVEVNYATLNSFRTEQLRRGGDPVASVLLAERRMCGEGCANPSSSQSRTLSDLSSWLASYRPDVVLGDRRAVLEVIEVLGIQIPRDLAFIDLSIDQADRAIAGTRLNFGFTGSVAVDLLANQMLQHSRGVPLVATSTSVSAEWFDGASLPICGGGELMQARVSGHTPTLRSA